MADGSLITTAIKVTNTAVTPSVCIKINSGRRSVGCSLENKWWSAKFPNPIELPEPGSAVCSRPSVSAQSSGEEAPRRCLHDRKRNQTQSLRINTSSDSWTKTLAFIIYCSCLIRPKNGTKITSWNMIGLNTEVDLEHGPETYRCQYFTFLSWRCWTMYSSNSFYDKLATL